MAARIEVRGRRGAASAVRLQVIVVVPKAVAAVDASDPVESGRLAQL
jgi:hypothetical protein